MQGYLVLENDECFVGKWFGGHEQCGEIIFNTSHFGYEEMATDPSYHNQIIIMTSPMQGNYGINNKIWESGNIWIKGFVCLEIQNSLMDNSWLNLLLSKNIPVLSEADTRSLVLKIREKGSMWGALIKARNKDDALKKAKDFIDIKKSEDRDWAYQVSVKDKISFKGSGKYRVAIMDFGCKKSIVDYLLPHCSEVMLYPCRSSKEEILSFNPDGILLSNGPGDPQNVQKAVSTVKNLLGLRPIFGICMGHQILGLALGAKTFKLKFGHHGCNHPIRDKILNSIYVTSQNHGYAISNQDLPSNIEVTHINLNDNTIAGIKSDDFNCFSVQFHPESHPGPRDIEKLFLYFIDNLKKANNR